MQCSRWPVLGSFIFALLLGASPAHAQGIITTVAGTTWAFRGDGGPATNAPLGSTAGVAVDAAGNVFASDQYNCQVVKISASGILTVVAGNGICGFSGDGGPATAASLLGGGAVAVDAAGNLYIADTRNNRIRKVTASGTITTVAGNGQQGYSGDGGPATAASLNLPYGVAADAAGNLYIADWGNLRVRKVTAGGTISTVAGNGEQGYSGDGGPATAAPLGWAQGVAVDAAGNLYIADSYYDRIRKVSPAGTITTVAGNGVEGYSGDGGPATAASLYRPSDVAVDAAGNLYIADSYNQRIRKVTAGGTITTAAGNGQRGYSGDGGPATAASLALTPEWFLGTRMTVGVAVDAAGNLYIADTQNYRIRKVTLGGTIATVAGNGSYKFSGDGGPGTAASLNYPLGVAVDAVGNLYIGDQDNNRIRKVTPAGIITTAAGNGQRGYSGDGGPATAASLNFPWGVAVDAAGNLYIVDYWNHRIRKITPGGTISTVAGNGRYGYSGDGGPATAASLNFAWGVAVDAAGNLYIADGSNDRIRKVALGETITTVAGNGQRGYSGDGGPATAASLNGPAGVAVDAAGNLYIADYSNNRIRKVTPGGTITTVAGNGVRQYSGDGGPATAASLSSPSGVAVDAAGNLYIADNGNIRIRKVTPGGTITTVAGNGVQGYSGDGGPATSAALNGPNSVVADAAGNLYIADTRNDRIRKVAPAPPSFSAQPGSLTFGATAGVAAGTAQQITLGSNLLGLSWQATARSTSGGNWLSASPPSGQAPVTVSVSADARNLAAGTYQGAIDFSAPGAVPALVTVTVTFTVAPAQPPSLAVEPSGLTFQAAVGASSPPSQSFRISNAGGGTLNWNAQVSTVSGGNWLSVSPGTGSASPSTPSSVPVSVNSANLAAGTYTGSVTISSAATNQTQLVTVALAVSKTPQRLLVSRTGLTFIGVERGDLVPSQSIGILNLGQGVMSWTAQASILSGGVWLSVSPRSGASDAASLDIPTVEVLVSVVGLRAGQHEGLVRIEAPGADDSPVIVVVDLIVLPAGSNPGVQVRPTGLIFAARAGTSSPSSQALRLATAGLDAVGLAGGPTVFTGGDWLQILPRNAVLSAAEAQKITVQPTLGSLAPGVYRAAVTFVFGDGSPAQTVDILFLVVRAAGASSSGLLGEGIVAAAAGGESGAFDAAGCTPQRLHAVHRALGANFSAALGYPNVVEVQVLNDCGEAVGNATVVASFSNGDPPVVLTSLRNGTYAGMWVPAARGAVSVTARAVLAPLAEAAVWLLGQVQDLGTRPALNPIPVAGSIAPASVAAGSPGLTLTVNGSNFVQGSVVRWNGADRPTTFVSATQLTAAIPASDLASAGTAQITVFSPAPGGGASGALAFTITGTVLAAFEPQLTRFLIPGFYILEATLAPGAAPGFWGLEVLASRGQAAGGFNLGGALYASGARPAFGAFLLTAPQTVKATVNAQMPAGSMLTMRFLDAQRSQIGNPVTGAAPLSLSYSLAPGFYIVEVYNSASVPVTYQLGLAADFFAGGVDTGGYLAAGITGFGAFYVPEAQDVTMRLFGQNTYGAGGAGSMILTLKDANRQVLQVVGP